MIELAAEYQQLWILADGMHRLLQDAGVHFCTGACGPECPLCVARRRFAPERPNVVLRTSVLEG